MYHDPRNKTQAADCRPLQDVEVWMACGYTSEEWRARLEGGQTPAQLMLACAQALPQRAARALVESAAAVLAQADVTADSKQALVDTCPPSQDAGRVQVDTCPPGPDGSDDDPGLASSTESSECPDTDSESEDDSPDPEPPVGVEAPQPWQG